MMCTNTCLYNGSVQIAPEGKRSGVTRSHALPTNPNAALQRNNLGTFCPHFSGRKSTIDITVFASRQVYPPVFCAMIYCFRSIQVILPFCFSILPRPQKF